VSLGTLRHLAFGQLPELIRVSPGSTLIRPVPVAATAVAAAGGGFGAAPRGIRPPSGVGIGRGGASVASTRTVPRRRRSGAHRPPRVHR
jgi:hypothetical protein